MKSVSEVLKKYKAEDVEKTVCGKGAYSKAAFAEITNALINDTTFKVPVLDKSGQETLVNFSEVYRAEMKKNIAAAGYPQKPEIDVVDKTVLHTNALAEIIPHAIDIYISCGKKFDFPIHEDRIGSIYLTDVKGKVKDTAIRDMKTGENLGTTTTTTQDHVAYRVKSQVPKARVQKVRKDIHGNVVVK